MELKVITGKFTKGPDQPPTSTKEQIIQLKTIKKRWYHQLAERWFGLPKIAVPIARVNWKTEVGLDSKGKICIGDTPVEVVAQEVNLRGLTAYNNPTPGIDMVDDTQMDQDLEEGSEERKGSYVSSLLLKYIGGEVAMENGQPFAYLYGKYPGSTNKCYSVKLDTDQLLLI